MTADGSSLPRLPNRAEGAHKGDFGHALLLGGSRGMAGAVSLAGMAALRGGAGLVTLAVPRGVHSIVASLEPSYMTVGLPDDPEGRIAIDARPILEAYAQKATAMACGPGLGRSPALDDLVAEIYTQAQPPAVFDADALNALAEQPDVLGKPGGVRILTPHPGEFARLCGPQIDNPQSREARAIELAGRWGVVLILKGHDSLVTDGVQVARNTTGNPGMATGGSGDVLTGVITALLCQGLEPFAAARLGAHVHGLAGDLAARRLGQTSLIARDLIDFLPQAFQDLATQP